MTTGLKDLLVRPDYDASKAVVTFTAPQGCSKAEWSVADGSAVVANGTINCEPGEEACIEVSLAPLTTPDA